MAYATPEQLAVALETRVTEANRDFLQECLDAAAAEIDHSLDRTEALPDPLPVGTEALLSSTNVNRAVEWYKAPATYNGGVGTTETGVLTAPTSGFARHAAVLLAGVDAVGGSLKQGWGLG